MNNSHENQKTKLSLTLVARGVGISPQNLHKTYIKQGKIVVCRNELNKPYIELVEVLRVFGSRFKNPESAPQVVAVDKLQSLAIVEKVDGGIGEVLNQNKELLSRITEQNRQLKDQKDQLEQARDREEKLFSQLDKLTDTIQRLEAPKTPHEGEKKAGFFSRLFNG